MLKMSFSNFFLVTLITIMCNYIMVRINMLKKKGDPHEPTAIFVTEYLLYIYRGSVKKSKSTDVYNKLQCGHQQHEEPVLPGRGGARTGRGQEVPSGHGGL